MLTNWRQKAMKGLANYSPLRWCEICRLVLENPLSNVPICQHCMRYFQSISRCQHCGLPTLLNVPQCGQCLRSPPLWQRVVCVGDYQPPLSNYIHHLKYQGHFWHAPWLAQLLAERVTQEPDVITCVPLHWRRHWQRGFNQSDLLGGHIAKRLGCAYQGKLFRRVRYTASQQGMNKRQRQQNLRHAFALNSSNIGRLKMVQHVAIVDDVMTTGSTVRHLSQLLLDAGVKSIDIYCLCRTPEPKD